jgi:SPP1 gp7 family putative phage head morphogenesis protein
MPARPFATQAEQKQAEHRARFKAVWLKQHGAGERTFRRALEGFFRDQAARIVAALREHGPHGGADALFRPSSWDAALRAAAGAQLERLALSGALTQWELYGPDRARGQIIDLARTKALSLEALRLALPGPVRDAVRAFLGETMARPYWLDINRAVRDDLARALGESIDQGDNLDQSAERVQAALVGASKARAERIVRTETTGALNAGHDAGRQQLQDMGLVKGKQWLAIIDGDTRPEHRAASGQQARNEADFAVGGERCKYPGDTRFSAGNRIHCRCVAITVLADL